MNLRSDAELPAIVDQYEKTLKETLEKHAPLKRRTITLRPSAPWYNEEIGKAKRQRRRLDRRWRSSRLCIHREMYAKQCQIVNDMIKDAKTTYYSSAISNNKYNQKVLFNTIDKLLHRKPKKRYPTASPKSEILMTKLAKNLVNSILYLQQLLRVAKKLYCLRLLTLLTSHLKLDACLHNSKRLY